MTRPRTRHVATNILWGLLCVAVIPVTSAAAQSSERGARIFSRVRAVSTASGIVLNRQDLAALAAHARIAETVEVEWPGKSGQVTSIRMSAVLERVKFELCEAPLISVRPRGTNRYGILASLRTMWPPGWPVSVVPGTVSLT